MMRRSLLLAALSLVGGCTLITGVNDYEVDPTVETRDLDYTFKKMSAHASMPLDVAVVNTSVEGGQKLLQARARIMLPPAPKSGDYPDERLVMKNALVPGPATLYFFVDSLPEDDRLEAKDEDGVTLEHVWVKEVDPSGVDTFVHSTMFVSFDEQKDFDQLNGDVVLELPVRAVLADKLRACLIKTLDAKLDDTMEVKLFLVSEDRQVGLFKTYRGNPPPAGGSARLRGIVDAGNEYRLETYLDGELVNSKDLKAPSSGDLVITASDWFPVTNKELTGCLASLK